MKDKEILRGLPGIEKLVQSQRLRGWDRKISHPVRIKLAQALVTRLRAQWISESKSMAQVGEIENLLEEDYQRLIQGKMRKVINATGVILHTNLGRAPLGKALLSRMAEELSGYCSLEFNLENGERGSRTAYVERLMSLLCGAEGSLVVNNNAAALYLILHTLAPGREVVVSRGELVQIGGGFRVPDILAASGAKLVEVGTTNMTHLFDFERALGPQTALILKVHQSNFAMTGHVESCDFKSLSSLALRAQVPLVIDLGSGVLSSEVWEGSEPTIGEAVKSKASLTCFSGDKLLGGPQAGIIVGEASLVGRLRSSPLYRALRLGKTEIFLLEETLWQYACGKRAPVWEMVVQSESELKVRSERVKRALKRKITGVSMIQDSSSVGGGTMPSHRIPGPVLEIGVPNPEVFLRRLRQSRPGVVVRCENKRILIDLRTVLEEEESILVEKILENI